MFDDRFIDGSANRQMGKILNKTNLTNEQWTDFCFYLVYKCYILISQTFIVWKLISLLFGFWQKLIKQYFCILYIICKTPAKVFFLWFRMKVHRQMMNIIKS